MDYEEPFEVGKRTVRIGNKRYPAAVAQQDYYEPHLEPGMAGSKKGFHRAWIPFENGNLVHVDYAPREVMVRHNMSEAFSVDTHGGLGDDFATHRTPEEVHAHLEELATKKLHPQEIADNQKLLRELRFHQGRP